MRRTGGFVRSVGRPHATRFAGQPASSQSIHLGGVGLVPLHQRAGGATRSHARPCSKERPASTASPGTSIREIASPSKRAKTRGIHGWDRADVTRAPRDDVDRGALPSISSQESRRRRLAARRAQQQRRTFARSRGAVVFSGRRSRRARTRDRRRSRRGGAVRAESCGSWRFAEFLAGHTGRG